MRLLTDEQHAQVTECLEMSAHSNSNPTLYARFLEALATLTAAPSVEVVGDVSVNDWSCGLLFNDLKPGQDLYAIKKETP